jgi:hypothetical protein
MDQDSRTRGNDLSNGTLSHALDFQDLEAGSPTIEILGMPLSRSSPWSELTEKAEPA